MPESHRTTRSALLSCYVVASSKNASKTTELHVMTYSMAFIEKSASLVRVAVTTTQHN